MLTVTEPVSIDYQRATNSAGREKNRSFFGAFGGRTRDKFNAKTDEPLWAGLTELTGQIRPTGQTLPTRVS